MDLLYEQNSSDCSDTERSDIENVIRNDLKDAICHGILVSNLAYLLAKELHMELEYCHTMAEAGMVHDIGKLKLSRYLYGRRKDTMLVEEMKYVRMHPDFGYQILKEHHYSETILKAIYHHHENYDGSGYPDNLKGIEIPWGARILRVCDVFAALISVRPYRDAFELEEAMELMIDEIKNFDMQVFLAFQRVVHSAEFLSIQEGSSLISLDKLKINEYNHNNSF